MLWQRCKSIHKTYICVETCIDKGNVIGGHIKQNAGKLTVGKYLLTCWKCLTL
jgi:NAD-dependent dihydropyrimidine dehydrogenase PreA subunit